MLGQLGSWDLRRVCRTRRASAVRGNAIGSQQRPFLAARLPVAVTDIRPIDAQTQAIAVGGLVGVCRLEAEKIGFHIASEVRRLGQMSINLEDKREYCAERRVSDNGLRQLVVERN